MSDLNKKIETYYNDQELPAERKRLLKQRLTQIQPSCSGGLQPEIRSRKQSWFVFNTPYWAQFAIAGLVLLIGAGGVNQFMIESERSDIVLRGAALYHETKLKLDFQALSIGDLKQRMDQLPFELTLPANGNLQHLSLVGGRYCTINGQLAAHLRFVDESSQRQFSLFQTALAPELERLENASMELNGMPVRLWNEDTSFYVLAGM